MAWILLVLVVVAVLFVVSLYNRLVGARNGYKNAFAQIDVQLTRRYDLIPNLVETAKGYMKHERETLEAVIQARNTALSGLKAAAANPGDVAAMTGLQGHPGNGRTAAGEKGRGVDLEKLVEAIGISWVRVILFATSWARFE